MAVLGIEASISATILWAPMVSSTLLVFWIPAMYVSKDPKRNYECHYSHIFHVGFNDVQNEFGDFLLTDSTNRLMNIEISSTQSILSFFHFVPQHIVEH